MMQKNLWFSALFENIPASLPNITFEEQKAFILLCLLKKP